MSDLIDRAAAIDALMAWEEGSIWDEECLKHRGEPGWVAPSDVIENLPSAPQYTDEEIQKMQDLEQAELQKAYECGRASAQPEIVRCKDCKYWEGERRGYFYYFEQCSLHERTASSDDFCSWAERREE